MNLSKWVESSGNELQLERWTRTRVREMRWWHAGNVRWGGKSSDIWWIRGERTLNKTRTKTDHDKQLWFLRRLVGRRHLFFQFGRLAIHVGHDMSYTMVQSFFNIWKKLSTGLRPNRSADINRMWAHEMGMVSHGWQNTRMPRFVILVTGLVSLYMRAWREIPWEDPINLVRPISWRLRCDQ